MVNEIIIRIYIKDQVFAKESNIEQFVTKTYLNSILSINIRGINNILNTNTQLVVERDIDKDGELINRKSYIVKTVGSDIFQLVTQPPSYKILKSDIYLGTVMDTYYIYGIEAARAKIIEYMILTMEGKHPFYSHLSLYADIMTWGGDIISIERAINKEKNKTFPKASGYSAGKVLSHAAIIGSIESTNTTVTPIMLGSIPKIGTNYSNILMDDEFIIENTENILDIAEEI